MELIKTVLRLNLAEALVPWLQLRGLIREAAEKPTAEVQGPPFIIDLPEKKLRIELHLNAVVIQFEGLGELSETIDVVLNKVESINKACELRKIKKWSYESHFIENYALPFHEILLLVKKRFLLQNKFTDTMSDMALVFDQVQNGILKHTQFGPMGKEQLVSSFLVWNRTALPDDFIFLISRYEVNQEKEYSSIYLKEFLSDSVKWQNENANVLFTYLSRKEAV